MHNFCSCCGLEFPAYSAEGTLCGGCVLQPPSFSFCRSVFHYQTPVDKLITEFKFHAGFPSAQALIQLLCSEFKAYYQSSAAPQFLIPVPLHTQRLRERGFNQSMEIARTLSKSTGIPINHFLVTRKKNTAPQMKMKSAKARKSNLRKAFVMKPNRYSKNSGKASIESVSHIAVIDDVVTTTATVSALSRCLHDAGIARVDVWSLARASR